MFKPSSRLEIACCIKPLKILQRTKDCSIISVHPLRGSTRLQTLQEAVCFLTNEASAVLVGDGDLLQNGNCPYLITCQRSWGNESWSQTGQVLTKITPVKGQLTLLSLPNTICLHSHRPTYSHNSFEPLFQRNMCRDMCCCQNL